MAKTTEDILGGLQEATQPTSTGASAFVEDARGDWQLQRCVSLQFSGLGLRQGSPFSVTSWADGHEQTKPKKRPGNNKARRTIRRRRRKSRYTLYLAQCSRMHQKGSLSTPAAQDCDPPDTLRSPPHASHSLRLRLRSCNTAWPGKELLKSLGVGFLMHSFEEDCA